MNKDNGACWKKVWEGTKELNVSTTISGYKDFRNKLRLQKTKKKSDQNSEILEHLPNTIFVSKDSYAVSRCVLRS